MKKTLLRRILSVCLASLFLITVLIIPSSATPNFVRQGSTSMHVDTSVHRMNFNQLISYNGYQYSAYYDQDLYLKVSRRKLSDNTVQNIKFTVDANADKLSAPEDGHNKIIIGISPGDGRLHISYNHHSEPHHYKVSDANWITNPPANINTNQFTQVAYQADATLESKLTYPQYFNDNSGNLYFSYRNASSNDNGDQIMNKYDSTTGTWSKVGGNGKIINGKTGSGSYTWGGATSNNRYSYTYGLKFDSNDRLHVAWTWNEADVGGGTDAGGIGGDHDISYAYSDDYGVTWKNNAGTQIANLNNSDPIRITDPGLVVWAMDNQSCFHGGNMYLDSNNQPHILAARSVNPSSDWMQRNTHNVHYWRNTSGQWFSKWQSDTSQFLGFGAEYEGSILFDGADNCYAIYGVGNFGWTGINLLGGWNIPDFRWVSGGYGNGTITNSVSEIITADPVSVPVSNNKIIKIKMKNMTASTTAKFYFITADHKQWDISKTFSIVPNDTQYREYTIDMSDIPEWTGTLVGLDYSPVQGGVCSGTFSIDYIRIGNGSTTVKAWEFTDPWLAVVTQSSPVDNYQTLETYNLLPPGSAEGIGDNGYAYDMERFKSTGIISIPLVALNTNGTYAYDTEEYILGSNNVIKTWEFASDKETWKNNLKVSNLAWQSGGYLNGTITGANAEIGIPTNAVKLNISSNKGRYVKIRFKNSTSATSGKLWYTTLAYPGVWRTKTFTVTANDSQYREYTIDMSGESYWTGTLVDLCLNPATAATSGSFSIDYIRIQH